MCKSPLVSSYCLSDECCDARKKCECFFCTFSHTVENAVLLASMCQVQYHKYKTFLPIDSYSYVSVLAQKHEVISYFRLAAEGHRHNIVLFTLLARHQFQGKHTREQKNRNTPIFISHWSWNHSASRYVRVPLKHIWAYRSVIFRSFLRSCCLRAIIW